MTTQKGQSMVEYLILTAIIAVTSIGIVKVLGSTLNGKLAQITLALQGKSEQAKQIDMPEVKKKHYEEKDLDDFYESAD